MLRPPPPLLQSWKLFFLSNQKFDAELCSAIARIARPSLLRQIVARSRHLKIDRSLLKIGIRDCITFYLPLQRPESNQACNAIPQRACDLGTPSQQHEGNPTVKNSFGTLEDLSQDFKILSPGTLSGPFGTLRGFSGTLLDILLYLTNLLFFASVFVRYSFLCWRLAVALMFVLNCSQILQMENDQIIHVNSLVSDLEEVLDPNFRSPRIMC